MTSSASSGSSALLQGGLDEVEPVVAPEHLVPHEEGWCPEDTSLDGRGGGLLEGILDLPGSRSLEQIYWVRPDPARHLSQRPVLVTFLENPFGAPPSSQ